MTKEQFLEVLNKDPTEVTTPEIIEVCQYYIDNYPVNIRQPMGYTKSKLLVKITGGSPESCIKAFKGLKKRINEFKN